MEAIAKHFKKIGAEVVFLEPRRTRRVRPVGDLRPDPAPQISIDIRTKGKKEYYEIRCPDDGSVELEILDVRPDERHLVLMSRNEDGKEHFLCGHDERHFFVAGVKPVTTVAQAKASLKPEVLRDGEVGLSERKRNKRKTDGFVRQGEWFFVPVDIEPGPGELVYENEPITRGGSRNSRGAGKPHWAQYAFRRGGVAVYVNSKHPNGLTQKEYDDLIAVSPDQIHASWRHMTRDAILFVKGTVRHPDHYTITLNGWHRVLMNTESRRASVAFLD